MRRLWGRRCRHPPHRWLPYDRLVGNLASSGEHRARRARRQTVTFPDMGLLAALRVLDMSCGHGDAVSRILADLGADVIKVEPPAGSPRRTALPQLAGTSI